MTGGRRKRLDVVPDDWRQSDDATAAAATAPTAAVAPVSAAGNECLINVTDFSDFQEATETERRSEQPVAVLQVPSITTTSISNNNNTSNNNNNTNNNSNMSRILQPRYRFRDLLLGDFSFNDDGER